MNLVFGIGSGALWLAACAISVTPLLATRFPPLYDHYHWLFVGRQLAALLYGAHPGRAAVLLSHAPLLLPVPNSIAPLALGASGQELEPERLIGSA